MPTPKNWVDAPPGWQIGDALPVGATPLDAAALEDMETRLWNRVIVTQPGDSPPNPTAFPEGTIWVKVS